MNIIGIDLVKRGVFTVADISTIVTPFAIYGSNLGNAICTR
jgi:hypothetical protein